MLEPQYCNKNGTDADPSTPAFDTWPEFDEDDPTQADGCILHNDDFLQYYLGAYIYASPGQTFDDEAGHPYGLAGTEGGPFEGLSWLFDETGANNQDHSATFVVTSSVLDPTSIRSTRIPAARPTGCVPVRRRSTRSAARSTWPPGRTRCRTSGWARRST